MSMTTQPQLMSSVLTDAILSTIQTTENVTFNNSVTISSNVTAWSRDSTTEVFIPYPSNSSVNQSAWLCDVNDSALWQLKYPICTTRYHSVAIFFAAAATLTLITLWTILGNVMVLVALYKYKTLRTMSNCLIGNLAISDLLLAITVLPVSTTNDLLGYWVFGDIACALWLCMDVLYCTASVWGLCTVAFDRYMATTYPVWYHDKRSVKKAVGCVVFVWIFSIIISLAPFIGWQHMIPNFLTFNRDINRYECILFMTSSYVIYSSVGSFVIPTCLMTFMYIRIFNVLHKQSKNMKKKIQVRAPSRRRTTIANGCPTIRIPEEDNTDVVVRDFTTTTLVSISAIETSVYSDDKDYEGSTFEQEHLLNVPRVSLLSGNGLSHCKHSSEAPDEENTNILNKIEDKQNGDSHLSDESTDQDRPIQNGSTTMNTSLTNSKLVVPDRLRVSQKRSNSLCNMPGEAVTNLPMKYLQIADLERRNSHEGTVCQAKNSDSCIGARKESPAALLKPVSLRSKSANMLSSSEEDGLLHQSQHPRRSLPCNLTKLGRNKKMTLSMKRRFELREQRATKRMLLIMACFCVCWVPFVAMYITRSLCHDCYMNTHFVAAIIWLGYVNSSLNPVLYALFNDDFKSAFKKLLGLKSPPPRGRR